MRVIRVKNKKEMSRQAANILSATIILKPASVLGLATGGTVIGVYEKLIDWYRKGDLNFSQIKTVNLDEYVNLSFDHPKSYHYFMRDNFFKYIDINIENTFMPDGMAEDLTAAAARYNAIIESLDGIDVQLLGLGRNGHIGFNEPGIAFEKLTHIVKLQDSTIESNARFFERKMDVPREAITMGIKSIMLARCVLLCVSGNEKADALSRVLNGPVTPEIPGSILQLHPNLIVVADEDALSGL